MIRGERDIGEKEVVHWKWLRLISEELARHLGIDREGPIFVSAFINKKDVCSLCGCEFSPLQYSPGHFTRAQHRHPGIGIFFKEDFMSSKSLDQAIIRAARKVQLPRYWLATLEPLEKDDYSAKSVLVTGIKAFCASSRCVESLSEGVIFEHIGNLSPFCGFDRHPDLEGKVSLAFQITEEGEVLFREI